MASLKSKPLIIVLQIHPSTFGPKTIQYDGVNPSRWDYDCGTDPALEDALAPKRPISVPENMLGPQQPFEKPHLPLRLPDNPKHSLKCARAWLIAGGASVHSSYAADGSEARSV